MKNTTIGTHIKSRIDQEEWNRLKRLKIYHNFKRHTKDAQNKTETDSTSIINKVS